MVKELLLDISVNYRKHREAKACFAIRDKTDMFCFSRKDLRMGRDIRRKTVLLQLPAYVLDGHFDYIAVTRGIDRDLVFLRMRNTMQKHRIITVTVTRSAKTPKGATSARTELKQETTTNGKKDKIFISVLNYTCRTQPRQSLQNEG